MGACMDGWIDRWMNGWMDGWMVGRVGEWVGGEWIVCVCVCVCVCIRRIYVGAVHSQCLEAICWEAHNRSNLTSTPTLTASKYVLASSSRLSS